MKSRVILGGPGCGKTRKLLDILEQELTSGVMPHEIAFLAFTRKAAHEARDRAAVRFGLTEDDLPWFKTLHALAFKQLSLTTSEVFAEKDLRALGKLLGTEFGRVLDDETGMFIRTDNKGAEILYLSQLARLRGVSLQQICEEYMMRDFWEVEYTNSALESYKKSRLVYDFTDMLEMYLTGGAVPYLQVVFIDEAQDLSPLQWKVVNKVIEGADRVYYAGDDDQAIYEWSGADVAQFQALRGDVEVLPHSHRLPSVVFDQAISILSRINKRYPKNWTPFREGGSVQHFAMAEYVDFGPGSWYVLARNRYMLPHYAEVLRLKGLPFIQDGKSSTDNDNVRALLAWEHLRKGDPITAGEVRLLVKRFRAGVSYDKTVIAGFKDTKQPVTFPELNLDIPATEDWMTAVRMPDNEREYYRAVRRGGESLVKQPRITLSTIHQVKGGEADHVLLATDISNACYQNLHYNPDSEHRVFYVGVTRAKESLNILYPRTAKSYPL